eukprot:1035409-Prorocentrum_minimum.AAC.1
MTGPTAGYIPIKGLTPESIPLARRRLRLPQRARPRCGRPLQLPAPGAASAVEQRGGEGAHHRRTQNGARMGRVEPSPIFKAI